MAELAVDDLAGIDVVSEACLSPDGRLVACSVVRLDPERDREIAELSFLPADEGETPPRVAPVSGRSPRWSPDGGAVAFVDSEGAETRVYLVEMPAGRPRELVSFAGGTGPAAWSRDGARIAFSAAPVPGGARRIAVVELETGAARVVPGDDGDDDTAPTWSPDGALAFARAPLRPPATGPRSEILVWRSGDATGPRPLPTGLAFAACPSWSPDGDQLACVGTLGPRLGLQDPCLQPWVVPRGGGSARLVAAEGIAGVIVAAAPEGPIWSADGKRIFFRAASAGRIDAVEVEIEEATAPRVLTDGGQLGSLSSSADGTRLAFVASGLDSPSGAFLYEEGSGTRRLGDAPGGDRGLPRLAPRRFPSPHGGELDGWLQGVGSGPAPQPLLVAMHGGPHNFVGPGGQLGHFHRSVLAARGWIVLTLNSSGSGSYGEGFADSIRGRWGEGDLPEYLAAVDRLVEEGLADPDRLAVAGYSYGGYLAAWTVCHTDRFRAAVVGAPIVDVESFRLSSDIGAWYVPWEMAGGPVPDPDRPARLSPLTYAAEISTPTLILHGDADRRCPVGQGEALRDRIAAAGRARVELVRYPGADHLFYARGRPRQRLDYNRRIVEWVERMTLGGEEAKKGGDGAVAAEAAAR